MTRIIRSIDELPEWFDLSKYSGLGTLSATGWYEQLTVRRDLRGLIGLTYGGGRNDYVRDEILPLIHDRPIVNLSEEGPLRAMFFGGPLPELRELQPRYSQGVYLATVRELYIAEAMIYPSIQKKAREWASLYWGDKNFLAEDAKTLDMDQVLLWIDTPVDRASPHKRAHFMVNTDLPDALLIKQFSQTLKAMRDPNSDYHYPVKSHTRPDFAGWVAFGALPYLDLLTWSDIEDVSIPNRVMADAIFPAGEGGEEVVRKTTEKKAMDLISDGHLTQLSSYAAYEIAERNSA